MMSDLVSMPIEIVPHLRDTIEQMSDKEEANFAIYHLGAEWGRETVKISGEKSDLEELKTKAVLTAVHSGITNLDIEIDEGIKATVIDPKIQDDYFLAGYTAGIISGLLGEYHIGKIVGEHFEIVRSDIEKKLSAGQIKGTPTVQLDKLDRGESYLIQDNVKDAPITFNTFLNAVEKDVPGLCITRVFPSKIKEKCGHCEFPIFWLSKIESSEGVNTITPEKFPQDIVKLCSSFLKIKSGILMVHGLEFLSSHGDFTEVLKAIQSIRDFTSIHDGIFLVAVDPKSIGRKEFSLLRSELKVFEI